METRYAQRFVYILLGAVGVPVFAGMSGGVGILAGQQAAISSSFILTALAVGFAADRWRRKLPLTIAMTVGVLLCYVVGTVWFMVVIRWDSANRCCWLRSAF